MQQLYNTLIDEFTNPSVAAVDRTVKADPAKDTVTISLKMLDINGKPVVTKSIRFISNQLPKSQQKLFVKQSYKNIENMFVAAKDEIINNIIYDNNYKISQLQEQNTALQRLCGHLMPSVKNINVNNSNIKHYSNLTALM